MNKNRWAEALSAVWIVTVLAGYGLLVVLPKILKSG